MTVGTEVVDRVSAATSVDSGVVIRAVAAGSAARVGSGMVVGASVGAPVDTNSGSSGLQAIAANTSASITKMCTVLGPHITPFT